MQCILSVQLRTKHIFSRFQAELWTFMKGGQFAKYYNVNYRQRIFWRNLVYVYESYTHLIEFFPNWNLLPIGSLQSNF